MKSLRFSLLVMLLSSYSLIAMEAPKTYLDVLPPELKGLLAERQLIENAKTGLEAEKNVKAHLEKNQKQLNEKNLLVLIKAFADRWTAGDFERALFLLNQDLKDNSLIEPIIESIDKQYRDLGGAIAVEDKGRVQKFMELGFPMQKFVDNAAREAIKEKRLKLKNFLISVGIPKEIIEEQEKNYQLLQAINANDRELIKMLVENGADINGQTNYGTTPLMYATYTNNPDLISLLVELGANINAQNNYSETALHYSLIQGKIQNVERLAEMGADFNLPNYFGITPLGIANRNFPWAVEIFKKNAEFQNK